ncbi:tryptophan synthase subunit alpha [Actinokineospora globicatena]|uniref:Tryptophan synthase alpha chain n=1 Tax=Actinokineospora globicatena TaxID=103729 RepID=A0A9W6QMP8_9PSEU|nr:tryptophan synthase subunit alpha [Actinokineospora globicatena]GLW91379.1 tryptophan synthase alpha chain [Actinokineospora globicatena]
MTALIDSLRATGRPVLVPYVTGGVAENWMDHVHAAVDAGADAMEIGIPFSDPVIDGPVIQAASVRALERGTTPDTVLRDLASYRGSVPLVVMTYYNLVHRYGHSAFASRLAEVGVRGVVLADLPMEESAEWAEAADAAGVATVQIAAPSTPDGRLEEVCARSKGFVYAMGVMGVTGERAVLADSACAIARRVRAVTDKPVLVGVGVSTPENAAAVAEHADGVVIGAPVMRRIAEGGSVGELVGRFRAALG